MKFGTQNSRQIPMADGTHPCDTIWGGNLPQKYPHRGYQIRTSFKPLSQPLSLVAGTHPNSTSFYPSTWCAGGSGRPPGWYAPPGTASSPPSQGRDPAQRLYLHQPLVPRFTTPQPKTSAHRSTVTPGLLPDVDGHPLGPLAIYNRGNPTPPTKASVPRQGIGQRLLCRGVLLCRSRVLEASPPPT